jgi:hypothetical protein
MNTTSVFISQLKTTALLGVKFQLVSAYDADGTLRDHSSPRGGKIGVKSKH